MIKEKRYVCVLDDFTWIKGTYFKTKEEAIQKGLEDSKKFNKHLAEGTVEKLGRSEVFGEDFNEFFEPIKNFSVVTCVPPVIPTDLGRVVLEYVSDHSNIAEMLKLQERERFIENFSDFDICVLNSMIYNFLDTHVQDIGFFFEEEEIILVK